MTLKDELIELAKQVNNIDKEGYNKAIMMHAKAHMFHNKKIHKKALLELEKYNIQHEKFDNLDEEK